MAQALADDLLAVLNNLCDEGKDDFSIRQRLGLIFLEADNPVAAIEHFNVALYLQPDNANIEEMLNRARYDMERLPKLRFQIGERVLCFCFDTHAPGMVIQHWYREDHFLISFTAAYQVRLDSGAVIYAPTDEDHFIKTWQPKAKTLHSKKSRSISASIINFVELKKEIKEFFVGNQSILSWLDTYPMEYLWHGYVRLISPRKRATDDDGNNNEMVKAKELADFIGLESINQLKRRAKFNSPEALLRLGDHYMCGLKMKEEERDWKKGCEYYHQASVLSQNTNSCPEVKKQAVETIIICILVLHALGGVLFVFCLMPYLISLPTCTRLLLLPLFYRVTNISYFFLH